MFSVSRTITRAKTRVPIGSTLVLVALGILIAVFTTAILGLDITHNTVSRTSLQNATDSAALAGAGAIVLNSVNPTNSFGTTNANWASPCFQYSQNAICNDVQNSVVAAASRNYSDGHVVSSNAGVTLCSFGSATNFYAPNVSGNSGVPSNNGQCLVSGTETIRNLFAGIVGHPTDNVTTQSIATAYATVTGVNANTLFPIAVSVDTIVAHDGNSGNYPLNSTSCKVSNPNSLDAASEVTFYLEDPCANAAWTTFNSVSPAGGPRVAGHTGSDLDQSALNYINQDLLPSVLGTSYNPLAGSPAQFVGEPSSTGQPAYSQTSGIDLWGSLSGAGSGFTDKLVNRTLILPVVGGDQPFWNLDENNAGTTYAPGARQTRPLLGFCAVKVTRVKWDNQNNCLLGIKGYLVKGLVKGTPGLVNPLVDATLDQQGRCRNAANMAALANLSPGMIQLGDTKFNLAPLQVGNGNQVALNSWFQGHVPGGNNTVQEASLDPSNQVIQRIASNFVDKMSEDMKDLCGGSTYNETINWLGYQSPPFSANGVGMLKYCVNGDGTLPTEYDRYDPKASLPFAQLLLNPLSQKIKITGTYSDEHTPGADKGLNPGYDVSGTSPSGYDWALAGSDPKTSPRYLVLDKNGGVMQQNGYCSSPGDPSTWPQLKVGPDTGKGQGHSFEVSMTFDPSSLNNGTGEYLVILHAFDTDLGWGGMAHSANYPNAPGTPPGGVNGSGKVWYGDAAFYFLDLQFPQCPTF